MFNEVDAARAAGTAPDPVLRTMSTPELAAADRYASGGTTAQRLENVGGWPLKAAGLPVVAGVGAGYEALKRPAIMNPLARALNTLKAGSGDQLTIDSTSSPASMGNVAALIRGYLAQKGQ